jgi:hypothetical protein
MEEWERKKILGDWGVGAERATDRRERAALEEALEGSPHAGRRVRPRPMPLQRSVERYVLSSGGPLPYMLRLREIEELTASHERALAGRRRELAETLADRPAEFARRWRTLAARWSFADVNDLIERHNRWYPVEARLPMDVRRRDFALVNGERYDKRPLDAVWILERFSAEL